MLAPSDWTWLALCLATESDEPLEQYHVAWVVRNRVEMPRRFPNTYFEVITQRLQFSFFNALQPITDMQADFQRCYDAVIARHGADCLGNPLPIAREVQFALRWRAPFGAKVDHYHSPCSMRPRGRIPSWASRMYRSFTPSGIDPDRFVFHQERQ